MTDLKLELIENGSADVDTSTPDDIEFIVGEMIMSRSNSTEEIVERTSALVKMLKPADAPAVIACAAGYAKARQRDVDDGDDSVLDSDDALLNGLAPWLEAARPPAAAARRP